MAKPDPGRTTVMVLGRGHCIKDGEYYASDLTLERTQAAVDFFDDYPSASTKYLFSGWYGRLASRGRMQPPPPGKSEAELASSMFLSQITVLRAIDRFFGHTGYDKDRLSAEPQVAVEPWSTDTFGNFTESIRQGHVAAGDFSPDAPLVFSANVAHAARSQLIARQALALPPGSLYRLPFHSREDKLVSSAKERLLTAMTRMALASVAESGNAEPGNLGHTLAAADAFADMAGHLPRTVAVALRHPQLWRTEDVLEFPRPAARSQ